MGVLKDGIEIGKQAGANEPDDDGKQQEQHSAQQHRERPYRGILKPNDNGEHNDADDVIDDGGADDGGAHPAAQMTHFPEGLHRNGNRGSGHDGADVNRMKEAFIARGNAIIKAEQHRTQYQRNKNADAGNEQRSTAGFFQLLHIGFQAGAEHKQNDANFRHAGDEIRLPHPAQHTGPDDQTGQNFANDLRGVQITGQQAKGFGGENDDGKIAADRIGRHN